VALSILLLCAPPAAADGTKLYVEPDLVADVTHTTLAGWSGDGRGFGYCVETEWEARCEEVGLRREVQTISNCTPHSDETCAFGLESERVKAYGLARGFGVWLRPVHQVDSLSWQVTPAGSFVLSDEKGGVRARIPLPRGAFFAHPEVIALSPDGRRIGVLIHYRLPSTRDDQFKVEIIPAA